MVRGVEEQGVAPHWVPCWSGVEEWLVCESAGATAFADECCVVVFECEGSGVNIVTGKRVDI